ncbi:MAG: sodium:proton antiporter [Muribaculaceae bacterium]|nr:sodium:proton antiporter [Muribaculaceae bacterium]
MKKYFDRNRENPTLSVSILPLVFLVVTLLGIIIFQGADHVSDYSPLILFSGGCLTLLLCLLTTRRKWRHLWIGLVKSSRQILPCVPILMCIGAVAATWMLGGVVPTMICYGLEFLQPGLFLMEACVICALVSVLSGSSWTTIATIGVALMGIGSVMGYGEGWVAGAIISGAYFGDKVSPLSDTTVLASSTCGVGLFSHIRNLTYTTVPAIGITLLAFTAVSLMHTPVAEAQEAAVVHALHRTFNITPWTLLIPLLTIVLLLCRLGTVLTLIVSALAGLAGVFILQPQLFATLGMDGAGWLHWLKVSFAMVFTGTDFTTGDDTLDALASTGGVVGMTETILLVLCGMFFGGMLLGSGIINTLTRSFQKRLSNRGEVVTATVSSGLLVNSCTADQFLSIIITGNLYKGVYRRAAIDPKVLSRSLEDGISVTSVLIPWNSCGVTQSTVLGVATLTYLPCCLFNILSPACSIGLAYLVLYRERRKQKSRITA